MVGLATRSFMRSWRNVRNIRCYSSAVLSTNNAKVMPIIRMITTDNIQTTPVASSSPNAPEYDPTKAVRSLKYGCIMVGCMTIGGLGLAIMEYGFEKQDEITRAKIPDEFTGDSFAVVKRVYKELWMWYSSILEPSREQLLPPPIKPPYHQPKYTLVIEMSGVLVHPEWTYNTGWRFKKRAALDYFIKQVGYPNFEVVIYTKESNFLAQPIIEQIDPEQRIMWKLFRPETKYMNGHHIKDLNKLGRDLTKVIIIDFDPNAFQLNPENALRVPKWEGDTNDTSLLGLAALLRTIVTSNVDDVRPIVQYYSQFDDPIKAFKQNSQALKNSYTANKSETQSSSFLRGVTEKYRRI